MLKDLARRLGAGLVAAVMMAVAAGIVLVAAAFALYAAMKLLVSPAAASAVTALAFAVIAGVIAVLAPRLIKGKATPAAPKTRIDPDALRTASEVGVAVLGIVGDMAFSRRLKRQELARDKKHRRR